ncbi:MAG: sensor histidine kinase [Chloroflexota bacterium]
MADTDTDNEAQFMRNLLHIIATTGEPQECFQPILEAACDMTGSGRGLVALFQEPHVIRAYGWLEDAVPEGGLLVDLLDAVSSGVRAGVHFENNAAPFDGGAIVGRLESQGEVVGLFVLDQRGDDAVHHAGLEALHHALTIVARSAWANARQAKLSRNQSEFMRVVSHDLRSPLTSMQGFASMLESGMVGEMNEKQAHFVDKILSGIAQMTSLVDNIQDAGRFDPETGFYEMQRAPCDLTDIVNRIVVNHLVPAEKQELTIRTEIADDIPIVNADVMMIERAITNLVDNAIKYTPNGRDVTVGLARRDDHIIASVRDSGLGISPEHQAMLFERHVRIPRKEHKRIKGSGLGLFIVRSVARRHGGNAWVESMEGQGSTFFISIPIAFGDAAVT